MRFFKRLNDNILQKETPMLHSLKKSNPFIAPENYFETLEDSIMKHVQSHANAPQTEPHSQTSDFSKYTTLLNVVSVLLVITVATLLYWKISAYLELQTSVLTIEKEMSDTSVSEYATQNQSSGYETRNTYSDNENKNSNKFTTHYQPTANQPIESQSFEYENISEMYEIQVSGKKEITETKQFTSSNSSEELNLDNLIIPLPDHIFAEKICKETPFVLDAPQIHHSLQYKWSTGESSASISIHQSGMYELEIFQSDMPANRQQYVTNVTILPRPVNSMKSIQTLCSGSTLLLEPKIQNIEDYQVFWNTNKKSTTITVDEPGMYILNIKGCKTYNDTVLVIKDHCDIQVPNSFTPNNDGINDIFYIHGLEKYSPVTLKIYNRNGFFVFSSNNYQNNWTADNVQDGIYYYIFNFNDGVQKHGTVTVFR